MRLIYTILVQVQVACQIRVLVLNLTRIQIRIIATNSHFNYDLFNDLLLVLISIAVNIIIVDSYHLIN